MAANVIDIGAAKMPNSGSHSNFNIDAMLALGRLEQGQTLILQTIVEHSRQIGDIQNKLSEISTITKIQEIHDGDISVLKSDVARFKEQRGWVAGAAAVVGAIVTFIIEFILGHHH